MKLILALLALSASAALAVTSPTGLTAAWAEGTAPNRTVVLTWTDHSTDETNYVVERKVGTGTVWADLSTTVAPVSGSGGTQTFSDLTIPRSTTVLTAYYYRVRAKVSTTESAPAEVVIAGIPNTAVYDTDADGINDADEITAGLNPNNWADGSADHDGDGIPNAWEVNMGSNFMNSSSQPTSSTPVTIVTVDPSITTDTTTTTKTITAALAKFPSNATHTLNTYRIIRVKPGIYLENLAKSTYCNVVILPQRSSASEHFEIRGTDATDPVINVTVGSLVIDGFILSRASGTTGPALKVTEAITPTNGISRVRMSNCIIRDINSGTDALVVQDRSRVVLSHCTFYMNTCSSGALAHTYSTGLLAASAPLQSTARLNVQNCIFWNPTNTFIPEFQSVGEATFTSTITYQSAVAGLPLIPSGCTHVNPGLTPAGYIATGVSAAVSGGTLGIGVLRDIHGEVRFNPTGRGADEWDDTGDSDGIPNFADTAPNSSSNVNADEDNDQLSDLVEYLGGSSIYEAGSGYLTMAQVAGQFVPWSAMTSYLSKTEASAQYYNKTASDARYLTPGAASAEYLTITAATSLYQLKPEGEVEFLTTEDLVTIQASIDGRIDGSELEDALDDLNGDYLSKDPATGLAYGTGSSATANTSIALGEHVVSTRQGEVVVGRYNVETPAGTATPADPVFVVGAGTGASGQPDEKKNAFVVRRDGNIHVEGVLRVKPAGNLSMEGYEEGPEPGTAE